LKKRSTKKLVLAVLDLDKKIRIEVSQIRYSLVVILGLNSVSGVQYKDMMIDRWWKVSIGIIDVVKSKV